MYSCFLKVSFFLSNLNLISLTFYAWICVQMSSVWHYYSIAQRWSHTWTWLSSTLQCTMGLGFLMLSWQKVSENTKKVQLHSDSHSSQLFFGLVEWPSLSSPHWQFLKLCFLANISSVTHWGKNQYHAHKIQSSESTKKSILVQCVFAHCLKITQNVVF